VLKHEETVDSSDFSPDGKRFIAKLEKLLDRPLFPKKGGRPPKVTN